MRPLILVRTFVSTLLLLVVLGGTSVGVLAQNSSGTIEGRITDARTGAALFTANVGLQGTSLGASTDQDGVFAIEDVPEGAYVLVVSYVGYKTKEVSIEVAPGEIVHIAVQLEPSVENLDEVVVSVGTRRDDRMLTASPVPVSVVTGQELSQSASTQTAELLQVLVPSFTHERVVRGDGSETVRPSRLRGMGTDQLLMLVNGRRRHVSGHLIGGSVGVDLNAIPSQAIDRVEVLRDGASAQYGSDAIAGVINAELRDDIGTEIVVKTGVNTRGDGENLLLGVNQGFRVGQDGFVNVTGEFVASGQVVRAGPDHRRQYFGTIYDENGDLLYEDPIGDSLNAAWEESPQVTMLEGDPERRTGALFLNAELPLGTATTAYAFGGASYRNFRTGSCRFRTPRADGVVRQLHPAGWLGRPVNNLTDVAATLGVRQRLGGGTLDASASFGRNDFEYNMTNSNNPSLGPASPTDFYLGTLVSQQFAANVDYVRAFDAGLTSPLTLAVGGELRGENFQIKQGEWASWVDGGVPILDGPNAGQRAPVGCQCYVGFNPQNAQDAWRRTAALYTDVEADLLPGVHIGLAGRFENYSDFGSTINGKVSARFEPVPGFALRGSAHTGFRAPSLHQSHYSKTQTNFRFDPDVGEIVSRENSILPLESAPAQALGAEPLNPETAVSYSAGMTFSGLPGLLLSADVYRVDVDDRIVLTSFFTVDNPLVADLFAENGIVGIQSVRFFTNAIDTRTEGIDIVAQYGFTSGFGQTKIVGALNVNRENIRGRAETPPELEELEETIFDSEQINTRPPGESNLTLMLDQKRGPLGLGVRIFRQGEYHSAWPVEEKVEGLNYAPPFWIVDVEASYRFPVGLELAVGGKNIFDQMPPQTTDANSFSGNFKYFDGNGSAWGVNGAQLYTRLTYTL